MSDYKVFLINIAKEWPKEHLDGYIKQLEEQITSTKELLRELRALQKSKEKKGKLRESGPRAGS